MEGRPPYPPPAQGLRPAVLLTPAPMYPFQMPARGM
jgi:hypothetical protein